jgi:CheY-like chemotaxis protein
MVESKRILLADDDPLEIELTLTALEEQGLGAEVALARDGVETLDYLHRRGRFEERTAGQPAVVLLDLKMPRLDGLGVLRAMRSAEDLRNIPVVVLTSSREPQDLAACYALGANAYVVKPVAFDDFVSAVRELGVFWARRNEPPPGTLPRPLARA